MDKIFPTHGNQNDKTSKCGEESCLGWSIFDCGEERYGLQRCDACGLYATDREAAAAAQGWILGTKELLKVSEIVMNAEDWFSLPLGLKNGLERFAEKVKAVLKFYPQKNLLN